MPIGQVGRNTGSTSGGSGGSGYSGFSGANPGASGYSGFTGLSGYSGFSGANPGASGYSGYSGISGYSGYSGISGYSGYSGISGYSGFSGRSGYSGYSGGLPPGSDTQVIFNDGGAYGADAGMTYNKTTDTLSLVGAINTGVGSSVGGTWDATEGTAPSAAASHDILYADSTAHRIMMSNNNSAFNAIGYLGIPQNSKSADYTFALADNGLHILHPTADNSARAFTIPANGTIAFPIGASITIVNQINSITIPITTDSLVWLPTGGTGTRTLAANGLATILKVAAQVWVITGVGLT